MNEVTREIVDGLIAGGIGKGIVDTDLGEAVIRTAIFRGMSVFTITFPEVEEKWMVVSGRAYPVKFTAEDKEKMATNSEIGTVDKRQPAKKRSPIASMKPAVERPRTKLAKEKKERGKVEEKPPTRRAYFSRKKKPKTAEVKGTFDVKGEKSRTTILIKGRKNYPEELGPVPKIGPKEPVWVRQLGWKGSPEKVDLNLYPVKIICENCGQPRYIDKRNAGSKSHPVTLCKPCSYKHKNRMRWQRQRDRRLLAKEAAEEKR